MAPSTKTKTLKGIVVEMRRVDRGSKLVDYFYFELEVGEYKKGMNRENTFFISNPAIRRTIDYYKIPNGKQVGRMVADVNHYFRTVIFAEYFPISRTVGFTKMGIGDFLDLHAERILAKKFPTYSISLSNEASKSRKEQWEKRGRRLGWPVPLPIAAKQTKKKVIANNRKARLYRGH